MSERASISETESRLLWVRAGGRCEYHGCNRYLLEDQLTSFTLNLADRAHIVGATDAAGSPRGDDPLALDDRNLADNLMLVCRDHHRVIDRLIGEHGVDGLHGMKRRHEERILLLTELQEDAETVVVRAMGGIRDAPVSVPRNAVLAAVRGDGRYPRYPLALSGEDLEIDLRTIALDGPAAWETAARTIKRRLAPLGEAQEPIHHVSVFALTRIPLLVALGYHLDDKIPVTVYGRRRAGTGDQGWGFDPKGAVIEFATRHVAGPDEGAGVALAVSVTAPIANDVQANAGPDVAVYELGPKGGVAHGRDLLEARASLDNFADAYHRFLADVEREHPHCEAIDLYAAVPVSGAVQLGRGVMRDVQPALRVHDRDAHGVFREALVLER